MLHAYRVRELKKSASCSRCYPSPAKESTYMERWLEQCTQILRDLGNAPKQGFYVRILPHTKSRKSKFPHTSTVI